MSKAYRFHETGGPEVLKWEDFDPGPPGPGEVRIRQTAIGVNFIDIYHRDGLYPLPLPSGIGLEGCGIIEAVGEGVDRQPGERVAYGGMPPGAYAEIHNKPASAVVTVPEDIDDQIAATLMLKGMTAQYLLRHTHRVKAGETILVHAAAGAVGALLCQWASHLGATVIGTAGSDEKAALAKAHGAAHCIVYSRDDFAAKVREITAGKGVPVVYDSVGAATFEGSLDCLAPLGHMVSFGNASGPVPPVSPGVLAARGSLTLTRPILFHYNLDETDFRANAAEVFAAVASEAIRPAVNQTLPLREAPRAQRMLEARETTGATVLIP